MDDERWELPVEDTKGLPVGTGTIARTLRLLMLVAEAQGPVSISALMHGTGLPASTIHRSLNIMVAEDYVRHDPLMRLYSPGPQMFRLSALVEDFGPVAVVQPTLDRLSARFDETAVFNLLYPSERVIRSVAKSDGSGALRYVIDFNEPLELMWGATGKSVLAHLDQSIASELYAIGRNSPTGVVLPDWPTFVAELAAIRTRGYAQSAGERFEGAQAVGSAVIGAGNRVIGGVCVTFPRGRVHGEALVALTEEIRDASAALSEHFGGTRFPEGRPVAG